MRTNRDTSSDRITYGVNGDLNTGIHFPSADTVQIKAGGNVVWETLSASSVQSVSEVVIKCTPITGAGGSTGVFASFANPFGYDVHVMACRLVITTQSTGASTLDIGVAANATTSNDGLIDGLSGATAGRYSNLSNAGTNGRSSQAWGTSQFLNVAEASGDVNGLVGYLLVSCARAL